MAVKIPKQLQVFNLERLQTGGFPKGGSEPPGLKGMDPGPPPVTPRPTRRKAKQPLY